VSEKTRSTGSALGEVAGAFVKLGVIAFGGPAAHIALMREEFVRRRKWLSDQHFLDLLGANEIALQVKWSMSFPSLWPDQNG
jgi:chromate transport protein ChrA